MNRQDRRAAVTFRSLAALSAVIFVSLFPAAACDRGGPEGESAPPAVREGAGGEKPAAYEGESAPPAVREGAGGEKPAAYEGKTLDAGIVATVNGGVITEREYADHLSAATFLAKQASFEGRMEVAQSLVDRMLIIQDAESRGLAERPMVRRMIERYRRRLVYGGVVKKIIETVPHVDEGEVDAVLSPPPGDRLDLTVILAEDLETAGDAIARIRQGEEMKEVAAEISISPGVFQRKFRRLGLEKREGMYPPDVEDAIFALDEGEVSAPLETPVGYLVARLDRRQSPTPEEIEELRRTIGMRLRREKIEEAVREEAARRREGTPVTMIVERVADVELPSPDGNFAAVWRDLEAIEAAEVDGVTLTFGDIMRDVGDYSQFIKSRDVAREKTYRRILEQNVEQVLFFQYARELGLDGDSRVVDAVEVFTEKVLAAQHAADISLAIGMEDLDDGECRSFFEERGARYPVPSLFTLSVIMVRRKEQVDEVLSRYLAGDSFEELAREYSVDPSAARGGDLGDILADDLAKRLSEEGVRELVAAARAGRGGAVTLRTAEGYHILLVRDFKDEGEGGFEAVRDRVLPDFLLFCRRRALDERVAALRERAVIIIDEEKVATIEPFQSPTPTGSTPHGGRRRSAGGASPHGGSPGGASPHGASPPAPQPEGGD